MEKVKCRSAAVVFVLMCLLAALSIGERAAWDCPECGRTGNTGNFCGSCAHPAPWTEAEKSAPPAVSAGDILTFGRYEQDNNPENGKEEIEWIVLEYDEAEHKALLISRYGLTAMPYHYSDQSITWENCTLRNWLANEFLNTAFTAEERKGILTTAVDNSQAQRYRGYQTNGGNDTRDRIFILSYQEAYRKYFGGDNPGRCEPTAYAKQNGAYVSASTGNCWWWLRSPGSMPNHATRMFYAGSSFDVSANNGTGCVRPALWLDLESGVI